MKNYKVHISSLKGIACIMVMLGHYIGIIKYSQNIPINTGFLNTLNRLHLGFLINESFWLYLFFIVSGYLCAQSAIKSFNKFINKSICRFLRLAIPILFANTIILIVYYIFGFHNDATVSLFQNNWFQNAYSTDLNILLLLKSPFDTLLKSNCLFNSPFWVLKEMLIASILVYFVSYIKNKFKSSRSHIIILIFSLLVSFLYSKIVFACMVGAVLATYEEYINQHINKKTCGVILVITLIAYIFKSYIYIAILLFSAVVLLLPRFSSFNKILSRKSLDYIGKISFGIYAFHWPVFCSIGAKIILLLWNIIGPINSIIIAITASIIITIATAIIFNITAEKWSSKIIKKTQNSLDKFSTNLSFKLK